jgi:hypothetical protein
MGLLNMGKGEGPQVIQLFGRGVRLKGKGGSLKRSSFLPEEGPHPEGLEQLEKLHIFGWNADYIQSFRKMLEQEDLGREFRIPVRVQHRLWPKLPVPRPKKGYSANSETWALSREPLHVQVDMTPQVYALKGNSLTTAQASRRRLVDFTESSFSGLLDMDALFLSLVQYKEARGYGNILIKRTELLPILRSSELSLTEEDMRNPKALLEGAARVLRVYLDRFAAASEREAEGLHLEPSTLSFVCESMIPYYSVRLPSSAKEPMDEVEDLLHKPTRLYSDGGKPLPRLHLDQHLFTPLLESPEDYGIEGVSVSPPGLRKEEALLLRDLREFWARSHEQKDYKDMTVYLLRNLPRVGVGFFRKSGFFPDFVMWLKEKGEDCTKVVFLEPHGLHHGGLQGNKDKMDALNKLAAISQERLFKRKRIKMAGFLLTKTKMKDIPDAGNRSWSDLEQEYPLLRQEGTYIQKLFESVRDK